MAEEARILLSPALQSAGLPPAGAITAALERAALAAGAEILAVQASGFTVEAKADESPVTEADRRAEAVILEALEDILPSIPVVAEEQVASGRKPELHGPIFVLVDALDGTREFVRGSADFTVNIAVIVDGVPAIGVVHAPAHRATYVGCADKAWRTLGGPGGPATAPTPLSGSGTGDPLRIVASRSHRTTDTDAWIARHADAHCVAIGSSLKFCLLAAGDADLYPRFGRTMEWDTAAGDAVLRAAGGVTLTLDGEPLRYGKTGQADACDFANPPYLCATGQAAHLLRPAV